VYALDYFKHFSSHSSGILLLLTERLVWEYFGPKCCVPSNALLRREWPVGPPPANDSDQPKECGNQRMDRVVSAGALTAPAPQQLNRSTNVDLLTASTLGQFWDTDAWISKDKQVH